MKHLFVLTNYYLSRLIVFIMIFSILATGQASARLNHEKALQIVPCQISSVIFDQSQYQVGDPIEVTIRLADHQGTPLGGAKVIVDVEKTVARVQTTTGFSLIDRIGEYDGVYIDTDVAGLYKFMATASDPTGQNFTPCSKTEALLVTSVPTKTPTPTITPTVPSPPNPTITPTVPSGVRATIDPNPLVIDNCDAESNITIIKVISDQSFDGFQGKILFSPDVVSVRDDEIEVDPDKNLKGAKVEEVNNETGLIIFGRSQKTDETVSPNTEIKLVTIDWHSQTKGDSVLEFQDFLITTPDRERKNISLEGKIQVTVDCPAPASPRVTLQGQTDHSGIQVTTSHGEQVETDALGQFTLNQVGTATFSHPGYLTVQANLEAMTQNLELVDIVLLGGDINNDGLINIFDLVQTSSLYGSSDPSGDFNGDGVVNIFDLSLISVNYGAQGPISY
ncbi:hypothetical protein QUF58_04450 [Anaerolineales bacterium HSG24]|nr:hypothetical protein [Anaerolineales bacterium HSG24]